MRKGLSLDIMAPYSAVEAFVYDRFIAQSVARAMTESQRQVIEALPTGGRLLDVGAGGGHLAVMIAKARPDADIVGLDLSPGQVARARKRAGRAGRLNCTFDVGDAACLPYESDSFDVVCSIGSVKHWPEPQGGIAEIVRVLRPGGLLFMAELDRREADDKTRIRHMVDETSLPACFRAPAVRFFHRYMGASLAPDAVSGPLRESPVRDLTVQEATRMPVFVVTANKEGDV